MKDLSIIIVNYNSEVDLEKCLASVYENTSDVNFEIIIVDNKSIVDPEKKFSSKFNDVKFIQMNYNAGFARANNEGIRIAKGAFILLLNPDIIITKKAIIVCVNFLKENSDFSACGCQLLNLDGTNQFSGGLFEKGQRWLLEVPYWRFFLKPILNKFIKETNESSNFVEWIIGAFLMTRSDTIKKAGMLDEDFFLYAEEIEWCSRLLKYGKMKIVRSAKAYHMVGVSSGKEFQIENVNNISNKREQQKILSVLLWLRKQYGAGWFIFSLACFIVGIPFYFFGKFFDCFKIGKISCIKEVFYYIRNVFVWLEFAPKILSNKPFFYRILK
jgi:GT2 family glycosyltransferase